MILLGRTLPATVERLCRNGILLPRGNRYGLAFRPAQGSQLAAEHAAGVDTKRIVEPFGFGCGRMAENDIGPPPVIARPFQAYGQAEFIDLAGRLAEHRKRADRAGTAPVHIFLQTGMGDNQPAVGKPEMGPKVPDEVADFFPEFRRCLFQFGHGQIETVGQFDVAPLEPFVQLEIMIADNAVSRTVLDHSHDQPQAIQVLRPPVGDIADENGHPAFRRTDMDQLFGSLLERIDDISETGQQFRQLIETTVDVADDIERSVVRTPVGPKRLPADLEPVDLLRGFHHLNLPEAFLLQPAQTFPQSPRMVAGNMFAESPVWPVFIAGEADFRVYIQDQGDRQGMVFPCQRHQTGPVFPLDRRCIDDSQQAPFEPQPGGVGQKVEGIGRCRLIRFVIRNQRAAVVGRHDLGFQEMFPGKAGLARARRPDQNDQGEVGNGNRRHCSAPLSKIAICDGPPSASSTGPNGENDTS